MKPIATLSLFVLLVCGATLAARATTPDAAAPPVVVTATTSQGAVLQQDGTPIHVNVTVEGMRCGTVVPTRLPLNLVLVLDKSGSMNADDKWGYVRQAVEDAIGRLGSDDYFTLITYDTQVQTVIPTTRNVDHAWARAKLANLTPSGSTNLHGGLSAGLNSLREHVGAGYVSRIVLLSDGQANVGPSSPRELRAFAEQASGHGARISTLGVGLDYNEDLMLGIAKESGGAYYFIDQPTKIASIFDEELTGMFNVVARDIRVIISLPPGVSYVNSLDRPTEVTVERDGERGSRVHLTLPELAERQKRQVHLELRLDRAVPDVAERLAQVAVDYAEATPQATRHAVQTTAAVTLTTDELVAADSLNADVEMRVVRLQSAANREQAMKLMDAGRTEEARGLMMSNAQFIVEKAGALAASPAPAASSAAATLRIDVERARNEAEAYESGNAAARKTQLFNTYEDRK